MALKQTTAPSVAAVTLDDAKLHLRVDGVAEDTLITALVQAATDAAEHHTGRAIMPQAWQLTLDAFPRVVELTRIPVTAVTSIKYDDTTGVEQTLAPDQYRLSNADEYGIATIVPAFGKAWPSIMAQGDAVRVIYAAGYADAAHVPESIKSWIKLAVGSLYENREAERTANGAMVALGFADRLLDRYRVYKL